MVGHPVLKVFCAHELDVRDAEHPMARIRCRGVEHLQRSPLLPGHTTLLPQRSWGGVIQSLVDAEEGAWQQPLSFVTAVHQHDS